MNNAICEFDWNLDKNLLIKELPTTETFSSLNPKWEKSFALGKYGLEIEKILSTIFTGKLKAGYYYQYKNTEVLEHKDSKCKFCQEYGSTDKNLNSELESLVKIKNAMNTDSTVIWRFATGIGEDSDKENIELGWFRE